MNNYATPQSSNGKISISWRAKLSLGLIIISLCSLFMLISIRENQRHIDGIINEKEHAFAFLMSYMTRQTQEMYMKRAASFAKAQPRAVEAIAARDREILFKLSLPIFKILQEENPAFGTMHFFLPDNTTLLRVHRPEVFGDDLSKIRPIFAEANRTRQQLTGYEVGLSGMLLRVTQPIFHNGVYVGGVEFGIRLDEIVNKLRKEIGPNIAPVMLSKDWQKVSLEKAATIPMGDYALLPLDNPFWQDLPPFDLGLAAAQQSENHFHVEDEGREYVLIRGMPLNDFKGNQVGRLLYAHDITELVANGHRILMVTAFATAVLLLLAFLILHFSFGILLDEIVALNTSLQESKNSLEQQVRARTLELEQEIREKKQIEEHLRQSQKMEALGTLAGGIAHDFNNLLYAIQGYSELTRMDLAPGSPAHDNLGKVLKSCNRAAGLVRQILTFSRKGSIEKRPLLLLPVIKETVKLLRETIPSTIKIRQELDQDCRPVLADLTQASQVIINLCTNATDAMRAEGGTLTVRLAEVEISPDEAGKIKELSPGRYARMTVEDTGYGIDPAVLERIFEPYFTTKAIGKGTGLGLSTVFGIVRDHHGVITVDSSPDRGSRFDVYLPLAVEGIEETVEIDSAPPSRQKRPCGHILFVDDEPEIVSFAEKALTRLGCRVTVFDSSIKALEMFKRFPDLFDTVITDLTMPEMTGIELARQIFRLRPGIPIILATGLKDEITEQKAAELGIRKCLLKPLSLDEIAKSLEEVGAAG